MAAFSSMGFIGGGRVTRIILEGLKRAGNLPDEITVSDTSSKALQTLQRLVPGIKTTSDNTLPAKADVVFLALHPADLINVLHQVKPSIKESSTVISLAPKVTISKIAEALGGHQNVARMIPNAPSIVNKGYNPIAFSHSFGRKEEILSLLKPLGQCPEVPEEKLEAYAVISAMGPTYLWFQLVELQKLAVGFGLTEEEAREAVKSMSLGSIHTLFESGLPPEEVIDLIPVKPLQQEEEKIRNILREKLTAIYRKLKE